MERGYFDTVDNAVIDHVADDRWADVTKAFMPSLEGGS